jgi:hypothetical protein
MGPPESPWQESCPLNPAQNMLVFIFTGPYNHSQSLCEITGTRTLRRTLAASPLFVLPHPEMNAKMPGRTVFLFSSTGFTFLLTANGCDTCRKSQKKYSFLDTYFIYLIIFLCVNSRTRKERKEWQDIKKEREWGNRL